MTAAGYLPVRDRTVRAAEVRELRHPEGTTLCRLPIELHAESRARGRQQVTVLPLGLHRDDVGQERSRPVGLLLDAEVRAREVQVQAGRRRDGPERVVDGELYVVGFAHGGDLLRLGDAPGDAQVDGRSLSTPSPRAP